jgi:hypothetical protein
MIDRKDYLQYLKLIPQVREEILRVYIRAQQLRLEMLGFVWGPENALSTHHQLSNEIHTWFWAEPEFNEKEVMINRGRGANMRFPSVWLSDPDLDLTIRKIYKKEQQQLILDKFEGKKPESNMGWDGW